MAKPAENKYYFFQNDHLGTPRTVIDENNVVVWEAVWRPFGEALPHEASTVDNPIRFPGQIEDKETGFHYNWHRYYDPSTGRYLEADPIGLEGGMNLYGYAQGNPVMMVDPTGENAMAVAVPISIVVSQLDSPLPGPADVVAGGIIGVALLIDTWPDIEKEIEKRKNGIYPETICEVKTEPNIPNKQPKKGCEAICDKCADKIHKYGKIRAAGASCVACYFCLGYNLMKPFDY